LSQVVTKDVTVNVLTCVPWGTAKNYNLRASLCQMGNTSINFQQVHSTLSTPGESAVEVLKKICYDEWTINNAFSVHTQYKLSLFTWINKCHKSMHLVCLSLTRGQLRLCSWH